MQHHIGAFALQDQPVVINEGKPVQELTVKNTSQRVIQIGSHFHFFESNRALRFHREAAFGLHLDIPSGTSVRWLPGEEKVVRLTAYGGKQELYGFNELTNGCVKDPEVRQRALARAKEQGFLSGGESQ